MPARSATLGESELLNGQRSLAHTTSVKRFNWLCSPACTELESKVTDWVAKLLGLDSTWCNEGKVGGGVIMVSRFRNCVASQTCLDPLSKFRRRAPLPSLV